VNLDLFDDPSLAPIPLEDADIRFMHGFYRDEQARRAFEVLLRETAWKQETIRLWDKEMLQPRLSAWYGDPGTHYTYSGKTFAPLPWLESLRVIKDDVERVTGHRFNSVLLNLYRNEDDSVAWHSDSEPEFGAEPAIASLSLGETRLFRLRHRTRKDVKRVDIALTNGSLLLMAGRTQRCWQHAIEKQRQPCGPRINLTFRAILPQTSQSSQSSR
jgi:alkylated DNA repair dioxygenase AlkB